MRLNGPALLLILILGACAGPLPHPPYVRQSTEALVPVGFPPPPARMEFIPRQPSSAAVWIGGEWAWRGRKWAWRPGRWTVAPPGAAFSPWTTVRDHEGNLFFAPGVWKDASSREIPEPTSLAVASPNEGPVTDPEGEAENTGRTRRPPDGGLTPSVPTLTHE
jgi:hypothetical protein